MTNPNDLKNASLRKSVEAAQQEFDMAVVFHEVWKVAAYDQELHKRVSNSYAGNAFLVVRSALRREMLLALARLWDKRRDSLRINFIADALRDTTLLHHLAATRVARLGVPESIEQMKQDLSDRAAEAIRLAHSYTDGDHAHVLKRLLDLRHEHLAHRPIRPARMPFVDPKDEEIELFYQTNAKLIQLLLSVISAVGYDPNETADVYKHHAKFFWEAVCGERTESHPNYKRSIAG